MRGQVRVCRAGSLGAWLADPASAEFERERLGPRAAFLEAVAFGLRDLERGVDLAALARRHGVDDAARVEARLREVGGRVERAGGRWRLTAEGALFADGVARGLLDL